MNAEPDTDQQRNVPSGAARSAYPIPREWLISALVIASAVAARSLLAIISTNRGFVEYNADGFSRVIRGYEWLQSPRWEVEIWLPFHFWFYGAALWIWNDIFLTPRLVNFLLGLLIIAGVYLIGTTLVERRVGLIAALLVAVFPYEVWLSMSGMSEPLFHALIVGWLLGLTHWWVNDSRYALLAGSVALAAATAVRYEAWFFVAVFVPLVVLIAFFRARSQLHAAGSAAAVSLSFIVIWMQQNWQVHGDALAFARSTEQVKINEDPSNIDTSVWERIVYFPEAALTTSPGIVLFGLIASAALIVLNRHRWWPVLALIWGQAALLVAVTSMFSSQGPGAERYMLINTILLCLPIAGLATEMIDRLRTPGMVVSAGMIVLILASFIPDWLDPPDHYPDADTRSLASQLESHLENEPDGYAVALLPEIPDERFNEGYALRVLSGYPDRVEITNEPSRLYEATQQGEASLWIIEQRLDVNEPPAEDRYLAGGYIVGFPPPPATATAGSDQLSPGDALPVHGADFLPHETISTWWTAPDEFVYEGPELNADEHGEMSGQSVPLPEQATGGRWALTLAGQESQRQAFVSVEVVE